MRNLKKALALVLALMMTLSLMVTASAADYADGGKIEKNEAVDVMSAINVFQGTDGGNFDPDGLLTRAQAAKIISYMKLGPAVAEALPKDEAPFDDVKADRWYTGYVTYAKAEGIINGRDEKIFAPNDNVTGYEFGKMVLEAAGIPGEFSATVAGSAWKLNINTALRGGNPAKTDLMANVGMATLAPYITREQACQLAFNALTYTPNAQGTGKFKISGVTNPGGVAGGKLNGIVCDTRTEALMMISVMGEASGIDYTVAEEKDASGSLADVVFGLKSTSGTTDFGATGTQWQQKDANGAYQNLILVANKPALTYNGKVTGGKIYADLGGTGTYNLVNKADAQIANTVVVDGKDTTVASLAIASGDTQDIGSTGAKVEVYVSGTNVKVVVTNTYIGTIATHTAAKGEDKENITLAPDTNKPTGTFGKFETTRFTDDDKDAVVLYTATTDGTNVKIQNVWTPAEVTGTVTRTTGTGRTGSFVMGGTTYKFNAQAQSSIVALPTVGTEYTMYLDEAGNVIGFKSADTPATNYAVLLSAIAAGTSLDNPTGSVSARLLLADGSTVDKTVTKVGSDETPEVGDLTAGKIYTYKMGDNDTVELTLLADKAATDTGLAKILEGSTSGSTPDQTITGNSGIERNKPDLLGDGSVVADKNTVFFITSADGKTCEKYVGISAVPSVVVATKTVAGTGEVFVDGHDDFQIAVEGGKAKLVYVARSMPKGGSNVDLNDVVYIVDNVSDAISDETATDYYEYSAVVNGEIVTLKATVNTLGGKLYKSTTENPKGLTVSGVPMDKADKALKDGGAAETGIAVAGGNVTVGSDVYVYTDNTKVFLFDGEELKEIAVTAIENDTNDKVWGYTDKDGTVAALFIEKVAGNPQPCAHDNTSWEVADAADSTNSVLVGDHVETCDDCGAFIKKHTPNVKTGYTASGTTHTAACDQKTSGDSCGLDVSHTANMQCKTGTGDHSSSAEDKVCTGNGANGCDIVETGACHESH